MRNTTLLIVLLVLLLPSLARAQSTAFTYQGLLKTNESAATGDFDLSFTLYSVETGGTGIATVLAPNTGVTNGLFSVAIDFGVAAFGSGDRWLEVAAKPAGAGSGYTPLLPRQLVTAAPVSLFAQSANAEALSGTIRASNLGSGLITASKLASNAVTTVSISAGSITPEKLSSSEFFGLTVTGSLHVNTLSTNSPPFPLQGTMTIERTNLPPVISSIVTVIEMSGVEVELAETSTPGSTRTYLIGRKKVSPLKVQRILNTNTSWKDWMRSVIENYTDPNLTRGTVTLQIGTGPQIILWNAFPSSYHIERGHDGLFYEFLTLQPDSYQIQ